MPIVYDITEDTFYQRGVAQGLEQLTEKVKETKVEAIQNMLEKAFDVKTISEILNVTQVFVKQVRREIKKS